LLLVFVTKILQRYYILKYYLGMTQQELDKLRKSLPPNWLPTLVARTGYSRIMVSYVLNNRRDNISIIEAAVQLAEEYAAKKEAITQKIQAL
jgi:hypothetical protein